MRSKRLVPAAGRNCWCWAGCVLMGRSFGGSPSSSVQRWAQSFAAWSRPTPLLPFVACGLGELPALGAVRWASTLLSFESLVSRVLPVPRVTASCDGQQQSLWDGFGNRKGKRKKRKFHFCYARGLINTAGDVWRLKNRQMQNCFKFVLISNPLLSCFRA